MFALSVRPPMGVKILCLSKTRFMGFEKVWGVLTLLTFVRACVRVCVRALRSMY